jgi:hypothetical protein
MTNCGLRFSTHTYLFSLSLDIQVYGVALYVSKRDVLADPLFEAFSTLSQEELRRRPDFFAHLRQMPSPLDGRGGLFDRTLLLKLNMQLSTDTMRSSLQGDWKMLTAESKDMLINSSLLPRPADDDMLATIQSDENPGKCSCGQVAPEEYGADPSCCSRGTELGFTWRKNGDLEVRRRRRRLVFVSVYIQCCLHPSFLLFVMADSTQW